MEQINLEKQNKTNLLKVCENLGIKNYKKLKKNELIQLINTRTNETKSEELEFDNVIIENESNIEINVENINGLEYLSQINNNSINLILTDPPYIISKDSGMNRHYNNVKDNEENNITEVKTEEEWEEYKIENEIENDDSKDNYIKYGTTIETECSVQEENILSSNYWENTEAFKSIKNKETQIKYYKRMNSSESVLQIVDLESKPFGSVSEKIIKEIFNIGERTSSQNDGTKNGKKIEIKSARYWAGKNDCVWQHLEPEHDYEYALFILLDFDGWIVWGIKKSLLMGEMRDKKIVTYQGKQGWWVRKSMIENYLTPIRNINDFDIFINS